MYKVYKIKDKETGECYIGHTNNMSKRISSHRCNSKTSSRDIMARNNYDLDILEYDIPDKQTALQRERHFYDITDNVINKNRPIATRQETIEKNRETTRQGYYRKHEYFKEKKRKYKEENKETLKLKRSQIDLCECGSYITHGHISTHRKKPIHFKLLSQKKYCEMMKIWSELLRV